VRALEVLRQCLAEDLAKAHLNIEPTGPTGSAKGLDFSEGGIGEHLGADLDSTPSI
jgi:hypothetical protein